MLISELPQYAQERIEFRKSGCLDWTGPQRRGYGQWSGLHPTLRNPNAHRVVYELVMGPVPSTLELHHKCRNKLCVNPAHLELKTKSQHASDHGLEKTHCKNGHEWTPENTRIRKEGYRVCRQCHAARQRSAYAKDPKKYIAYFSEHRRQRKIEIRQQLKETE